MHLHPAGSPQAAEGTVAGRRACLLVCVHVCMPRAKTAQGATMGLSVQRVGW